MEEKSLSCFYIHRAMLDGHLNFCKDCTKKRIAKHRENNLEYIQWYDRQRANYPHRKQQRLEYWKQHPEAGKRKSKEYAQRYPEKYKAKMIFSNAVDSGMIKRKPCVKCGKKAQGHHEDYSKPLDVIWLCPKHHAARHRQIRDMNRKTFKAMKHGPYKT